MKVQAQTCPRPIPVLRTENIQVDLMRNYMNVRALELVRHLFALHDDGIDYLPQGFSQSGSELTKAGLVSSLIDSAKHVITVIGDNYWHLRLGAGNHSHVTVVCMHKIDR